METQSVPPMPHAGNFPPAAPATRKNWWGRNWKWFVPTGCLTLVLIGAGFIFLILSLVFGMMKSSDPYKQGLAAAQADVRVTRALGTPVEPGYLVTGNINISNGSGSADLTIPVSGPKGSGTVYVVASKSAGVWKMSTLSVAIDASGERLDLLEVPMPELPEENSDE